MSYRSTLVLIPALSFVLSVSAMADINMTNGADINMNGSTGSTIIFPDGTVLSTASGTGADGADGATGPAGPQGPAGTDGADGSDGAAGADGTDGSDAAVPAGHGGTGNTVSGADSFVGGGGGNTASDDFATVGGGHNNTASGYASFAAGFINTASGNASFAAGSLANASHDYSFVWGDAGGGGSAADNTFNVHASGGIYLNGVSQHASDRNKKEAFEELDPVAVLSKVAELPITSWRFKTEDESVRHIGPMAQDFMETFGYGTDDRYIAAVDVDGIALAAIQGLNKKLEERDQVIAAQDKKLSDLEGRLAAIETALAR